MGNDGGSIPTRVELVREARKEATTTEFKAQQRERLQYGWTTDPLSRRPLTEPIVADSAGVLYRKESVLEYLLQQAGAAGSVTGPDSEDANNPDSSSTAASPSQHAQSVIQGRIKSLKDVVVLHLHRKDGDGGDDDESPAVKGDGVANGDLIVPVGSTPKWICPVSNKELGPAVKAVFLVPCGHVFAAMAIKELKSLTAGKCLECDADYDVSNVIPILPTDPVDIKFLADRSKELASNRLTHSLKRGDKKRKRARDEDSSKLRTAKTVTTTTGTTSTNINNAATAAITAHILREHSKVKKLREATRSETVASLFTPADAKDGPKQRADFMTRGFAYKK